MLLQRIWSQFKIWCFLKEIVPAGTKKVDEFLSHFMPIFNLHIDGQCLKIRHWFCSNFCLWNQNIFICSHLCFKRLYRILDIKLRKYLVFLQNAPLKLKIKAFKIFVRVMIKFAKIKIKSTYLCWENLLMLRRIYKWKTTH